MARKLESHRHAHLFFSRFKNGWIIVSHNAIVHEILDRVLSVDHFSAVLARDDEERLVDGGWIDFVLLHAGFKGLGHWVNDGITTRV